MPSFQERLGLPLSFLPAGTQVNTRFDHLLSGILIKCPNHRRLPSFIPSSIVSLAFMRFLISSLVTCHNLDTLVLRLRQSISTVFKRRLVSALVDHISLPYRTTDSTITYPLVSCFVWRCLYPTIES